MSPDSIAALAILLLAAVALVFLSWQLLPGPGARKETPTDLVRSINAALPQTQCGRCGHPGCLPYAEAIAAGAAINKCPPGGDTTILRLSRLLAETRAPLDPAHGEPQPAQVAFIREAECIGCTKCIQACPVDAILGAAKLMHTVLPGECTGCDLCVEPCPVDCIDMLPVTGEREPATAATVVLPNAGTTA